MPAIGESVRGNVGDAMEYFNTYDRGYLNAINSQHNHYKIKLELMTYFENVIGDITKDVSVDAQGQININYQPITRRSCSLSMINIDDEYVPSPDNTFWYERKFKLWLGVVDRSGDIYWWAQGVFLTQSATSDGGTVNIEAVDKGGALDGTLGMNMVGSQYIIKVGSSIDRLVKDTLMLDMGLDRDMQNIHYGGVKPLDPATPIIDLKYRNITTQAEISIDSSSFIGDIFTNVANGYGADIYYDINGHLQVAELTNGYRADGYKYMAHQWEYGNDSFYAQPNYQYSFDGRNAVTVFTNSSNETNLSYTAYNNNPKSPLRVGLSGVRRIEDCEIDYTDISEKEMYKRCKDYANYLLIQEALKGATISFNSPIIPHLDVNRTIGITDKHNKMVNETCIIQTITMPLYAGEMSISATSVNWLPNSYNIEGIG